jgi:hypothetical protein
MTCNCGAPGCRKVITGRDWMKPELQQKYRGYFSWYLEKKIEAEKAARTAPANSSSPPWPHPARTSALERKM